MPALPIANKTSRNLLSPQSQVLQLPRPPTSSTIGKHDLTFEARRAQNLEDVSLLWGILWKGADQREINALVTMSSYGQEGGIYMRSFLFMAHGVYVLYQWSS